MATAREHDAEGTFYRRVFGVCVTALLAWLLYHIVKPFLAPLAWAVVIAYLAHPVQRWLTRHLRGRTGVAAGVLTAGLFVTLLGPMTLVGAAFASQAGALVTAMRGLVTRLQIGSIEDLVSLPAAQSGLLWLEAHVGISVEQLRGWTVAGLEQLLAPLASLGSRAFFGAFGTAVSFGLTMFLLFFFLRDGDAMFARVRALIPMEERRKERLLSHSRDLTRAIVFGAAVTSLVQGLIVGVGFAICGLPSPVVFGVLAALLAMLPVGGTALVWGPAVIWLFFDGRWGYGIFLLAWGVLLGTLDNVWRPLLISGRARISTLAVFIGVLGGIPAFGAIGLIAGPVILSLALALIEFAEESRTQRT